MRKEITSKKYRMTWNNSDWSFSLQFFNNKRNKKQSANIQHMQYLRKEKYKFLKCREFMHKKFIYEVFINRPAFIPWYFCLYLLWWYFQNVKHSVSGRGSCTFYNILHKIVHWMDTLKLRGANLWPLWKISDIIYTIPFIFLLFVLEKSFAE